ncbi:sulfite exporter TauE/SafE family protein [Brevibacillus fulvus]|uniref:Probable membrane transporter protein n=1 Tax=Brevibacillus fulvus TaxID=1125967 RepID=A0A938Y1Z5_9BACL|nr:sulfite exporter TauE/SafE family protein [Brevibacillus fulvus]MBM7589705.1 putative membrane protein YfcA [Brevibacillus fulvus]
MSHAYLYLVLPLLGLIGSFFSGLLGIGGAIINYPLLLFIPAMVGVAQFSGQEVSGISMFQVFFSSLAGVLAYRFQQKSGSSFVHRGLVLYMGGSILLGSLMGSASSKYLSSDTINFIYGILAVIAVLLMLIPSKGKQVETSVQVSFNKTLASMLAFLVGIVSGIVGAGGAFILIPLMLAVLKIPTRVTIASSLAIVFISAVGGVTGKLTAGHIPLLPTVLVVIGSIVGAPIGSRVSAKLDVKLLRYGLVLLLTITAIKVWSTIL